MAGTLSDETANAVLNLYFGATADAQPANHYLAACTVAITDADTGSTITEPSGNGYVRLQVANDKTTWTTAAAATRALANAIAFTWAQASGGNWGTITDVAVVDAATAGRIVGYADLITPQVINDGGQLTIPIGDLDVTLT